MRARRTILLGAAGMLLVLALAVAAFVLRAELVAGAARGRQPVAATNLTLDVRLGYDPGIFSLVTHDPRAEYPLRLDADDWSFYGKRIRGLGKMLAKDPAPLLYDFVGSQHVESLEQYYGLAPVGEPVYEDVQIKGRLGLHQRLAYRRTEESRGWPSYFPVSVTGAPSAGEPQTIKEFRRRSLESQLAISGGAEIAYIEGWALFTENDLFFFQAVSPEPLTVDQRAACNAVLESMEFDVLWGSLPPVTAAEESGDDPEIQELEVGGE